jgi:hypothetical protein
MVGDSLGQVEVDVKFAGNLSPVWGKCKNGAEDSRNFVLDVALEFGHSARTAGPPGVPAGCPEKTHHQETENGISK